MKRHSHRLGLLMKMEKSPYFSSTSKVALSKASSSKSPNSNREEAQMKRTHIKVEYSDDTADEVRDVKVFGFNRDNEPSAVASHDASHVDIVVKEDEETKVKRESWEPPNWRDQLRGIQEMRKAKDAPVDTMGCERCHDHDALPQIQRYQILVSLMLSSQTKDEVTSAAMTRLKQHGLTPTKLLDMPDDQLGELIKPVGFWRKKIVYLKKATTMIVEKYAGDIPTTVEELCKLPGVGPKMAYLAVQCAWKENVGIGVDTHVHRISQRLGWLQKEPKNPEETRKGLEEWLPKEQWADINALLVGFGQQICRPIGPHCNDCLIRVVCPFGSNPSNSPKKSPKKIPSIKSLTAVKKEEVP